MDRLARLIESSRGPQRDSLTAFRERMEKVDQEHLEVCTLYQEAFTTLEQIAELGIEASGGHVELVPSEVFELHRLFPGEGDGSEEHALGISDASALHEAGVQTLSLMPLPSETLDVPSALGELGVSDVEELHESRSQSLGRTDQSVWTMVPHAAEPVAVQAVEERPVLELSGPGVGGVRSEDLVGNGSLPLELSGIEGTHEGRAPVLVRAGHRGETIDPTVDRALGVSGAEGLHENRARALARTGQPVCAIDPKRAEPVGVQAVEERRRLGLSFDGAGHGCDGDVDSAPPPELGLSNLQEKHEGRVGGLLLAQPSSGVLQLVADSSALGLSDLTETHRDRPQSLVWAHPSGEAVAPEIGRIVSRGGGFEAAPETPSDDRVGEVVDYVTIDRRSVSRGRIGMSLSADSIRVEDGYEPPRLLGIGGGILVERITPTSWWVVAAVAAGVGVGMLGWLRGHGPEKRKKVRSRRGE